MPSSHTTRSLLAVLALTAGAGAASAATWTMPATQLSAAGSPTTDASSVVDRFGTTTIAWQQFSGSVYQVWVSRSTATGWTEPLRVSTDAVIQAKRPRLAVEPDGDVRLVWQETVSADPYAYRYVKSRTFSRPAGTWGATQQVVDGTGGAEPAPEVAVDADGTAYVVYVAESNSRAPRVVSSTDSGWGTPEVLTASYPSNVRIGVPATGKPVVMWTQGNSVAAAQRLGATWTTATVSAGAMSPPTGLDVAVGDGRMTAAWSISQQGFCMTPPCPTTNSVWTARYRLESGWEQGAAQVGVGPSDSQGSVATAPNGDDVFTWLVGSVASATVKVRTRRAAGSWDTAQAVSGTTGNNLPAVDVDPAGVPTVAWIKGSSQPFTPVVAQPVDGTWTRTELGTATQVSGTALASGGTAQYPTSAFTWIANSPERLFASTIGDPVPAPPDPDPEPGPDPVPVPTPVAPSTSPSIPAGPAVAPVSPSSAPVFAPLRFGAAPSPSYAPAPGGGAAPTDLRSQVLVPGPGTIRQIASTGGSATGAAREAARRPMLVCSDTARVGKAGTVTVTCPLTPAARRTLRRRSIQARIATTFIGTDGTRARSVRTITIPRTVARGARVAVTG